MPWSDVSDRFEMVVGLEVHAQLRTRTKLWCACPVRFGEPPNTLVCPVCLGLPGSLPVLNRRALELGLAAALALGCEIPGLTKFDRKNYFYPDLPKNYQLSQYDIPFARGGAVEFELDRAPRKVGLVRIHLEEDAGKLIHCSEASPAALQDRETPAAYSLVDLNRAGTPLLEIVTRPDIRGSEEAHAFLTELKAVLQYLDVSDCNMEEGSLRCDANVSVRLKGDPELRTRCEIKNLNSFRFVQKALDYEAARQAAIVEGGGAVVQQTLLFDEGSQRTLPMRTKEEAEDYRYFPDPDLLPVALEPAWLELIRGGLPELPGARRRRFLESWDLPAYDVGVLCAERPVADYVEAVVGAGAEPKAASNWVMGEVLRMRNESGGSFPAPPVELAGLIALVERGAVNRNTAKEVLAVMAAQGKRAEDVVAELGLAQVSDESALAAAVDAALAEHARAADEYRAGKKQSLGFLIGQVMRGSGGRGNPQVVRRLLLERLEGPPA